MCLVSNRGFDLSCLVIGEDGFLFTLQIVEITEFNWAVPTKVKQIISKVK
jgi:hypothetical protein